MPSKFLLLLLVLTGTGCATYAATSGRVVVRDDSAKSRLHFSDRDRSIVTKYYRLHRPQPILAAPGLVKGKVLPSGLQGRILPRDLEARLRALPQTHLRLLVGRDLVLMERNTREVQDILYGVAN